jgi:hypothetical protein
VNAAKRESVKFARKRKLAQRSLHTPGILSTGRKSMTIRLTISAWIGIPVWTGVRTKPLGGGRVTCVETIVLIG